MPAVRTQWRLLRLTERFVRDVALSIGLPRRLIQLFWQNAPSAVAWPPSAGLGKAMGLMTLLNRYHARMGDQYECFVCYDIPREGVKTKCCHRIICRSCAESCFSTRCVFPPSISAAFSLFSDRTAPFSDNLAKCAWCRTQQLVSMAANFESLTPEEDVGASLEKERVMKEKCSLIVEFYISEFVLEEADHDAIPEPTLKLLIDLVFPIYCCVLVRFNHS